MKILVTAFEPFGLHKFLSNSNASKEVAEDIKDEVSDVLILPVDPSYAFFLQETPLEDYDYIICLGEDVLGFTRIEEKAYGLGPGMLKLLKISDLASSAIKQFGYGKHQNIGDYYCNRVYFKTLLRNSNTMFIHLNAFTHTKNVTLVRSIIKWLN